MNILFAGGGTGGHLYPALAIARAVVKLDPSVKPFFVGARRGIERDVLPRSGFAYELLELHPLYRSRVWNNWRTVAGMIGAWRALARITSDHPPSAVVGTGGYVAGAALLYAAAHDIPVALQVLDSYPGLVLRQMSRFAREVYVGYPEAIGHLSTGRHTQIFDVGNPIEPPPSPRPDRAQGLRAWGFPPHARVLLVYGGSQGAKAINVAIRDWIARGLPDDLHLIWMTGQSSFAEFASSESSRVRVREYLSPASDAFAVTDLAVARAGAMTTSEFLAWGIPSLLVPLPTAAADHQTRNAQALEANGCALHLPQSSLTAAVLDGAVRGLLNDPDRMQNVVAQCALRARPQAAETVARRVLKLAQLKQLHS